jgi:uncharacterized protein involved in response to NO
VTAAAILRISASLWAGAFLPLVSTAAMAWIVAFLFFLGVIGPVLMQRHLQHQAAA